LSPKWTASDSSAVNPRRAKLQWLLSWLSALPCLAVRTVPDADDAWTQLQDNDPLKEGDVVYIGDIYYELIGDGGWRVLQPNELTRELYALAANQDQAG